MHGVENADRPEPSGTPVGVALRIRHDAEHVRVNGVSLTRGWDGALLGETLRDAPIDIEVRGWKEGTRIGRARDGRSVLLHCAKTDAT